MLYSQWCSVRLFSCGLVSTVRLSASWASRQVLTAVSYSTMILGATVFFSQAAVPRSMPFIYFALALLGIGGTRLTVRAYYQAKLRSLSENVIIYGAGESGRQLLTALHQGDQYRVVAFVDDDNNMQRSVINGLRMTLLRSFMGPVGSHRSLGDP